MALDISDDSDMTHDDNHFLYIVIASRLPISRQSINQWNFYSAPYKTWTAALDNVNV